jgi:hypothetical protein
MADKKISQLTAASTPLAGTEVLPIVQSGSTVKVSAADVTAGRQVSAAGLTVTSSTVPANGMYLPATNTIGFSTNSIARARLNASGEFAIGNIATPRAELDVAHSDTSGSVTRSIHLGYSGANFYGYRVSNTNNAGAAYAGTFAIQRGEGTQWTDNFTISDVGNVTVNTGNLVVGTAAKGIDFSANTGAAGMTSELLNWYEEGTWTPTVSGASGTTYTTQNGWYTRIGNLVTVGFELTINAAGTITGGASIAGLPFTSAATYKSSGSLSFAGTVVTSTVWQGLVIGASQSVLTVYVKTAASASTTSINGSDFFGAGTQLIGLLTYRV